MKTWVWVVIVVVVVGLGWFLMAGKSAPVNEEQMEMQAGTEETGAMGDDAMMEDGTLPASGDTVTVKRTATGFEPSTVTVKKGTTVMFVNEVAGGMWVASAAHPSHVVYDGTDLAAHCAAGATPSFDQCGSGETYSFTFDKAGTWNYHNHVMAGEKGSIVVTE